MKQRKFNIFEYIYAEAASQPGELSDSNAEKLYNIIKSRINRKFGSKVYFQKSRIPISRDGETIYGVMFMLDDGDHAFRLNYKQKSGGAVSSIDFWIHPSNNPQLHVDTRELNVLQLVGVIEEVIEKKKTGTIIVDNDGKVEEEEDVINEDNNKRVSDEDEDNERSLKKKRRKKVRVERNNSDEQVKIRDEFSALFDDPLNDDELFSLLEFEIRKIKNKTNRALLILGDPGIGKSYTVTKELVGENAQVFKGSITGPAALYKTLFIHNDPDKILIFDDLDALFDNDQSANILKGALDSAKITEIDYLSKNNINPLFYDVLIDKEPLTPEVIQKLEAMKINTEMFMPEASPQMKRLLSKLKARAMNPESPNAILPNKFNFRARVIFISNRYLEDFPSSLISRSSVVEVSLTMEQIVNRIEKILPNFELDGVKIDMEYKKAALKFLKEVVVPSKRIPKIDLRGFGDIVKFAMSPDTPKEIWYRWAAVSLKNKYTSPSKEEMKKRIKR